MTSSRQQARWLTKNFFSVWVSFVFHVQVMYGPCKLASIKSKACQVPIKVNWQISAIDSYGWTQWPDGWLICFTKLYTNMRTGCHSEVTIFFHKFPMISSSQHSYVVIKFYECFNFLRVLYTIYPLHILEIVDITILYSLKVLKTFNDHLNHKLK